MSRSTRARCEPTAWGAKNLRLTTFHPHGTVAACDSWWAQVLGDDPETVNNKPKAGEYQFSNSWLDGQLALQVNKNAPEARIDWLFTESPFAEDESTEHPAYPEKAAKFLSLMQTWVSSDSFPFNVSRVAFGAVVALPVEDLARGYATISNYLNFDVEYGPSSEFMFQINRRRPSAVIPLVEVNRLSKWSVVVQTQFRFGLQLQAGAGAAPADMIGSPIQPSSSSVHCQIELDINTVPLSGAQIQKERVPDLVRELTQLTEEIVSHGDIS